MIPRKWTLDSLIKEASKYESMKEFRVNSEGAYKAYVAQGKPSEVLSLFPNTRAYWTVEQALEEAGKYKNRWDFQRGSGGAYRFLWKSGKLDLVFDPLTETPDWDFKSVKDLAKGYIYRSQFKMDQPSAFRWAYINNKLDEIFGPCINTPNSDRDVLYIWKVFNLVNVFKVGVTSKRLGNKRVNYVCRKGDLCAEQVWSFETQNASELESYLLRSFEPYEFPNSFSGSKEFRVIQDIEDVILRLENSIEEEDT